MLWFEVGVFCGQYRTPVPDDYFDHLVKLHGSESKKRKSIAISGEEAGATLFASSGPVDGTLPPPEASFPDRPRGVEHQEDIR